MREANRNPLSAGVREELQYWDEELARNGAYIVLRRQVWATRINRLAGALHNDLVGAAADPATPFQGHLGVAYLSGVAPESRAALAPDLATQWQTLQAEAPPEG